MKKSFIKVGVLTLALAGLPVSAQFNDSEAGHWAQEAVEQLADQGILVGFPDGSYRGREAMTRYQAAEVIYRTLLTLSSEELSALGEETLTKLRNAVLELESEMESLGARVERLEGVTGLDSGFAPQGTGVSGGAAGQAGVDAGAAQDLLSRAEAVDERFTAVEGDVTELTQQVEANAESVRALDDLVVTLSEDMTSLDERVTALETQERFKFATEFNASYNGIYLEEGGENFDIDRLFPRPLFEGELGDEDTDDADLDPDPEDTGTQADLSVTMTREGEMPTEGFGLASLGVGLRFNPQEENADGGYFFSTLAIDHVDIAGEYSGQPFTVRYAYENTFIFSDYLFANDDDGLGSGIVVSYETDQLMVPIKLMLVAGSTGNEGFGLDDYVGIRGVANLLGIEVGASYAERNLLDTEGRPVVDDGEEIRIDYGRSAFGFDISGSLAGLLELNGEYVVSKPVNQEELVLADDEDPSRVADQVFYIDATVNYEPASVNLSYRAIDPDFELDSDADINASAAGISENDPYPYDPQRGFGVGVGVTFAPVTLNAYYDRTRNFFDEEETEQQAIGVSANANIASGFGVNAYYNNLTDYEGNQVFSDEELLDLFYEYDTGKFASNYGIRLFHDPLSPEALVTGLNLAVEYRQSVNQNPVADQREFDYSDLAVGAGYEGKVSLLTLNPVFRYHTFSNDADYAEAPSDYSSFKYGLRVATEPLAATLSPTLHADFAARNTDLDAADNDPSEYRWGVFLGLNDLLLADSRFIVGYSTYHGEYTENGYEIGDDSVGEDTFFDAYDPSFDNLYDDPGEAFGPISASDNPQFDLQGIYLTYRYAGFGLTLGEFWVNSDDEDDVSRGRGFQLSYRQNF